MLSVWKYRPHKKGLPEQRQPTATRPEKDHEKMLEEGAESQERGDEEESGDEDVEAEEAEEDSPTTPTEEQIQDNPTSQPTKITDQQAKKPHEILTIEEANKEIAESITKVKAKKRGIVATPEKPKKSVRKDIRKNFQNDL